MLRATALLAAVGGASGLSAEYVRGNGPLLWADFKNAHRKKYSGADEAVRYNIFMANMLEAAELEEANPQAQFGASKFADLSKSEFKAYHSLRVANKTSPAPMFSEAQVKQALASSVDWRSKGAVTQVKDQAQCGSCWAFSSTGGIEGQWYLAGNKLTSVSEQELVSCDKVDSGCSGGLMDNAYKWLVSSKSGKIVTESAYPYTSGSGSSGSCKSVSGMSVGATITGHTDITHSESQMAAYVSASGPLPIAVDAQSHWQTYTGGIVSSCTGTSLDHGVLAVGYTSEFWIVKNSWGSSWGESGYIRLAYGSNQCGLNKSPTAAIASGAAPSPPTPPGPSPPAPVPPSPPAPVPPATDCLDIETQSTCGTRTDCTWCQYDGFGICGYADIDCPVEASRTAALRGCAVRGGAPRLGDYNGTCAAATQCTGGEPCCQVLAGTYECCFGGESCIPNVGCRC